MYVEVRWIIFGVVAVVAVGVGLRWPHLVPALALGAAVCGVLYLVLRLGDRVGIVRRPGRRGGGSRGNDGGDGH